MPDNKLKQFHDSIKGNPNISGVPDDFNTFQSALNNPATSKAFFDAISKNEAIGGLPKDYNTFASSLGIVEKKSSNVPSASSGMGVSMEFKGSPQKSVTEQILKTIPTSQKKPDEEGMRIWDRAKSTLSTLGKSVVDGVAATSSEQIAILSKTIDDEVREFVGMKPLNKPITEYQTYKLAQQIKETTTDVFKPNPEFQGEIQETVAQTAGDLLGLVASAVITKNPSSALAKLGTKGIIKGLATSATRREITKEIAKESVKMLAKPTTFIAAAQTGTRNYDEALKKGATEDEANAMYWSTALTGGIANNLPVGALLNRFDKASGGKMKEVVLGGVVGGIEEAVTEGIEAISTNFAAQNIYDETRKLFEGVEESAAMGGGIGFVLNAMGVKLGAMRNKFKDNPEKVAEIDQSIDYLKDIAETSGKTSAVKLSREEQIKVDRLNKTIENPDIPNEAKDIAKEQLQQITGAKILDAETTQEKLNSLSEDDKVEVRLLDAEIDRIKQAADSEVDVDIKDELLASMDDLNAQKEAVFNAPPKEIVKTEEAQVVPFEQQLDEALDMSSVEEVNTETPLTEREQQMLTVPEDRPINTSIIGKFFENVNTKTKTAPTNPIKKKIYDFITPISKSISKMMTTGDINAVRAKEIVDAESGATIEKLKSISTKIQNLVGKDPNDRKLANQVLSMDFLDDKVSKLAASDNYTALSELTENKYSPEQIKQAVEFYKGGETEGVSTVDKSLFDAIVKDVSGIGQQTIADKKTGNAAKVKSLVGKIINYDTVGKTTEDVSVEPTLIQGSQSPMLTGSELAPAGIESESRVKNVESSTVEPVTLTELRAELASLPNGQEILRTVDESVANRNLAEQELSKTPKGRKILEQAKAGRELMDSFSDYISTNKAAAKIQERIGETIAGNKGSYLKRSFRFWKDKKFEPTEALKNVALESVVNDMMVTELVRLNKSPEYNRLEGDAKRQYLKQITDDVRRKAEITLNTYLDEIRQQRKDGAGFFPNTKAEKIDGRAIEFRKLIDESFLNLLGNINDPISQFHDTVLAQTQIKSAANLHWIINQVTGKENMFDSREQVVEFNGSSDGFKQISNKNSLLDGKWVSEDIYDAIANNVATKDGLGYHIYRKTLSTMRKIKTIYNFFAGWTTNLIGGEVTLMANGIVPNPKNTGKYLLNRLKYVKNPEKLDKDIQDDIKAMKDNGFWSTSISAGTIKLIDDSYLDMTAYDRGEEFVKSKTSRFINKAKRIDDNIIRNYSAIDDFTKLVFFREKKDIFSEKLYGKKYDQLTKIEKDKVHANVAERGKENIATMSRLPRVYQRMAKYPLGDFMAFRISAIKSGVNTIVNALQDINTGTTDKSLSKEQRAAYLRDGYTTMFSMTVASIANSMFYGQIASFAMGLMSEKDEEIFKKKTDGGVNIGSKADLYTDFKGTPAVSPQWMRGKNNIVAKDDGKGNIELLNISNKDPYDELFGMFLPRAGTDWRETMLGIAKETFSPNMTVNLFTNIMKGEDQWGKDIYTGDDTYTEAGAKIAGYILTESLVPPAIKNLAKESYKEIQQSKAVEGDSKKDIKEKPVGGKEYFNALVGNTPMLLNRTYKVNLVEQYGFYAKDFYQARPDKFDKLDQETKDKRFEDLSRLRDGYQYLRKYSILNNNPDVLKAAIGILRDNARGMSKKEENFILYGKKSY